MSTSAVFHEDIARGINADAMGSHVRTQNRLPVQAAWSSVAGAATADIRPSVTFVLRETCIVQAKSSPSAGTALNHRHLTWQHVVIGTA